MTAAPTTRWLPSSKRNPCPICGRSKDGDCRTSGDGLQVICHRGSSLGPPQGLKPSREPIKGKDGQDWAFTHDNDRGAHFKLHQPLDGAAAPRAARKVVPFRRPAAPAAVTGPIELARIEPIEPKGSPWSYSSTQRTRRYNHPGGEKSFRPQFHDGSRWATGAGESPWPMFGVPAPGWVLELEGEKCCEIALAAGFAAVSQPGHDHTPASITRRYRALREAGVAGVVYVADNDTTGQRKAQQLQECAAEAGLPLQVLNAVDLWPDVPAGGSIDDAPGTAAERVAVVVAAIPQPQPDLLLLSAAASDPLGLAKWGHRKLGHGKAMRCFERCVEVQAKRERNSLRRRARLLKAAQDLGLAKLINRQEIAQRVLEAKDQQMGYGFSPLTAADRVAMTLPPVEWVLPNLVPNNDLTIVGGRPKIGKTRFAIAVVRSVLQETGFLDFPAPSESRPVILVTDDQADADTAQMLEAMGLWDHPNLIWSRHFRLTERDINGLLETIKANPGALVVIDSLRSVSRALPYGENDPEIGAILYDLKAAVIDAGGSLLLIHHCNKTADLVGVEALSGHSTIAGTANTVITLHHLPDDQGRPQKDLPERRVVREARTGDGFDLVTTRCSHAGLSKLSTYGEHRQRVDEAADEAAKLRKLNKDQKRALELLEDAEGELRTLKQICEAMGLDPEPKGSEAKRARRAVERLEELELIESEKDGKERFYWSSSHIPKREGNIGNDGNVQS